MANAQRTIHTLYKKLLRLYPQGFREQLGESMEKTFHDLYEERRVEDGLFHFVFWTFAETTVGIIQEHIVLLTAWRRCENHFLESAIGRDHQSSALPAAWIALHDIQFRPATVDSTG